MLRIVLSIDSILPAMPRAPTAEHTHLATSRVRSTPIASACMRGSYLFRRRVVEPHRVAALDEMLLRTFICLLGKMEPISGRNGMGARIQRFDEVARASCPPARDHGDGDNLGYGLY